MKIVNNTQKYVFLQNVVCRNKKNILPLPHHLLES